jgi:cell division protein FtsI (penicillin-binding protein 3)
MNAKKTIVFRTRLAFLLLLIFGLAIIGKLIHIQIFQGQQWKQRAKDITLALRLIPPTRGSIYAQDGNLLATSLPYYEVAIDPCVVNEKLFLSLIASLSNHLANFYGDLTAQTYQRLITQARAKNNRYLLLNKRQVTYQEKQQISQWPILKEGRLHGGSIFNKIEKRFKPFQELASRTIGFINKEGHGVGLELSFDKELRGIPGKALYQKLAGDHWKILPDSSTKDPIHGYDIITTIDIHLQDVAHASLLKILQQSQANYGVVIVMEVKTGEIKAMVNLSKVTNDQYKEVYNYAIGSQGTTEPGSSFKLVAMLALLEETKLELTDTVDTGNGKYQFYGLTMRDTKDNGYGILTIQEVFEKSSNIGMAKLLDNAFAHKPERFIDYIYQLGLHQPLGIPLQGEGMPFIKHPNQPSWTKVTLPWMAMGYELQISPLQVLTLYNAIANNGTMIQPLLVKEIKKANTTIQTFHSRILNPKICSDRTLSKLKIMLEGVVERGTASKFRHGFYKLAGKSGTSNKLENGTYSNATYASFVGYFPAENPRYSCIVVIDDPKGEKFHFGGQVAAPVVKEIADRLAAKDLISASCLDPKHPQKLSCPATKQVLQQQDWVIMSQELNFELPSSFPKTANIWIKVISEGIHRRDQNQNLFTNTDIPNVVGMNLNDALFLLENRGIKVKINGPASGYITSQSIMPGTKIHHSTTIILQLQ